MIPRNRPSVFQIGRVTDDGEEVVISGWGLGLCMSACTCHRHPATGHLTIHEDQARGQLGLSRHRACGCCAPWTAEELAAVVADFARLESMPTLDVSGG